RSFSRADIAEIDREARCGRVDRHLIPALGPFEVFLEGEVSFFRDRSVIMLEKIPRIREELPQVLPQDLFPRHPQQASGVLVPVGDLPVEVNGVKGITDAFQNGLFLFGSLPRLLLCLFYLIVSTFPFGDVLSYYQGTK